MTNTLNDQLLEEVRVEVEESEGWSVVTTIPIPSLPYGNPATTYTVVEMEDATQGQEKCVKRERGKAYRCEVY